MVLGLVATEGSGCPAGDEAVKSVPPITGSATPPLFLAWFLCSGAASHVSCRRSQAEANAISVVPFLSASLIFLVRPRSSGGN